MSEKNDTSKWQLNQKASERLKESIERYLLMRGFDTPRDFITIIDNAIAHRDGSGEGSDVLKIKQKVFEILEGLNETEINRIRNQVTNILDGKGVPSLTPLLFISRALNVRLGTFLDGDSSKLDNLKPAICHRPLKKKDEIKFGDNGETLIYHPLSMSKSGISMEPYIIDLYPPANPDTCPIERHAGEEFIYVLKGRLVVHVGNEIFRLEEGDSIYYHGYLPHHVHGDREFESTQILAVVYAPPLENTLSLKELNMNNRFGETLSKIRRMMNLDIAEVSRRTGLRENVISSIESGEQPSSLTPLLRITQALGVRLWTVITNGLLRNYSVFRRADLDDANEAKTMTIGMGNLKHHFLAINMSNRNMEPFFINADMPSQEEFELDSHEGEEFLYVLKGRITVFIGSKDKPYVVEEGESIYYDPTIPHHVRADENGTQMLAVVYTPPVNYMANTDK